MTCSEVELACCKLCHKPIASNLGECIHCGVCNPVEKKERVWWHYLLVAFLLAAALLGSVGYDQPAEQDWGCATKRTRDPQNC